MEIEFDYLIISRKIVILFDNNNILSTLMNAIYKRHKTKTWKWNYIKVVMMIKDSLQKIKINQLKIYFPHKA